MGVDLFGNFRLLPAQLRRARAIARNKIELTMLMKMTQNMFQRMLAVMGLVLLSCPVSSQAATANVVVGSSGGALVFTPFSTNINVGDRVIWTWAGSPHNVTSTNSAWVASPTQGPPLTFTNTFNTNGSYFYYCSIHGTPTTGMRGEVVVNAANVPPTVTITNPASGAVFAAPANVTLQASTTDSGGTVTNVQFLIGSTNLGNVAVAPYSAVANSLNAGSYTFFAIASDNVGATATNSVSISVVSPVPVQLSAPLELPPAKFQFTYTANTGLSYIVLRSTNLGSANWTVLSTNLAGSSSINFTDQNATGNPGFYRVGRLPNP